MSRVAAALAVAALAWGIAGCGGARGAGERGPRVALAVDAVDGGVIRSTDYRGRPVVIHAFTTWDPNSTQDVELLARLHEARGDDVVIIGVALDPDGHTLVVPWRRAMGVTYLVGTATAAVRAGTSALGSIDTVPLTLVVSARGRQLARIARPLRDGELEALLFESR